LALKGSDMAASDKSDNYLIQLILDKIDRLQRLIHKRKKPFLTIQEASEYLDISVNTLYGYTSKGILPFYKIRNRKLYFRISDLNRFVLSPENRVDHRLFPETRKEEKKGFLSDLDQSLFIQPRKNENSGFNG
jgi:excisionase family DNA binding protein